jgi:hypothetical protein
MPEISRRYELKLVTAETGISVVRSWTRLHPVGFRTAFPPRRVNSIYLDTHGYRNLNENLAGIEERQKLRLRWYGELGMIVEYPILEMKIKEGQMGHKKQEKLDCSLDLANSWPTLLGIVKTAVSPAFLPILKQHSQPALINSYQREYYTTPDQQIRLTLDYDQRVFDQRVSLMPNWKRPLPIEKELVIELKAPPDQADRLNRIMGRFPLLRSRNSKYVKGMMAGPR